MQHGSAAQTAHDKAGLAIVRRGRHTWARAHSRTETMRSCSGWNTWPTLPMGWGSVVEVGKWPCQSSRPYRPRQPLCRSAVLGRHQGTSAWPCTPHHILGFIVEGLDCAAWSPCCAWFVLQASLRAAPSLLTGSLPSVAQQSAYLWS